MFNLLIIECCSDDVVFAGHNGSQHHPGSLNK